MPNPIQITTNYERAVEVAKLVIGMLERKVYPFNIPDLFPDAIVPGGIEAGSEQHRLLLFYACGWDSMDTSERVYQRARTLASKVDLTHLSFMSKEDLTKKLIEIFGPDMENAIGSPIETLCHNARKLVDYGRDPKNLKAETLEETIKNIKQFKQYADEKAALLIKNFVRFGVWDFSEFEIPIKIDRHALKIGIGAGIVTFPLETKQVRYDRPIKALRQVYQQVTQQEKISAVKLDDAMWGIGAKLCMVNIKSYCQASCPIGCETRPYLDGSTTIFHIRRDTREQTGSLFSDRN